VFCLLRQSILVETKRFDVDERPRLTSAISLSSSVQPRLIFALKRDGDRYPEHLKFSSSPGLGNLLPMRKFRKYIVYTPTSSHFSQLTRLRLITYRSKMTNHRPYHFAQNYVLFHPITNDSSSFLPLPPSELASWIRIPIGSPVLIC